MLKFYKHALSICALSFLSACGGGGGGGGNTSFGPVGETVVSAPDGTFRAAQSGSPYRQVLVDCLAPSNNAKACTLATLPFIGQHASNPTKSDILDHTIVSHAWMATRFGDLLDQMPGDIRLLFRGVTGVTIGADIRPSYYDPATGGIYLDPDDLWMTQAERDTISKAPDFRSEYGSELKFVPLWRYVKNGSYAWHYTTTGTRSLNDLVMPLADLLFHELAHANDFMPPALLPYVSPQNTANQQIDTNSGKLISLDLYARSPLMSDIMHGLGQVLYQGATATAMEKTYSAGQVGSEFETDGASDTYAYSSPYEDTAMLFEEVMMRYHYSVDREVAFSDAPLNDGSYCNDYIVRWGQRNRIGDPLVKSRAQIVVKQLLGRDDTFVYFAILPSPKYMVSGADWCTVGTTNSNLQKPLLEEMNSGDLLPPHNHPH